MTPFLSFKGRGSQLTRMVLGVVLARRISGAFDGAEKNRIIYKMQ